MSLIYYRYDEDLSEYLGGSIGKSLTFNTSIFFCHPVGSCNAADKHQSIVQERTGKMVKMYQVLVQSFKKNYYKCRVWSAGNYASKMFNFNKHRSSYQLIH